MNNNDIPNTEFIKSSLSDSVLTITLNRPEAMNAFRPEMLEAIAELIEKSSEDQSVSVVVLEGEGRAFSAGVDLKVLQGIKPKYGQIGDLFNAPAERAVQAIRQCQCPVIAKVHGACFTGALEVALHCDFIYTTVDTKFGDTHAKFGLRPTWGMAQTLSQAVGVRRAKELSYTARVFKGEEARE
jgi:enoyl-CoA hydratase/carnithine racemase